MKVEVVRAWPRRFESVRLELGEGATLAEAVAAAGFQDDAQ
ncbi:RnfH family protein, partial [Lysobacter sp. 2RAB21]